jgi:hypothetical protein
MSTTSVNKAIFASKRIFVIIYWTNNGLAMINGATMQHHSFTTKALMVQNQYQE